MKLRHLALPLLSLYLLSGCTALGFMADMAIIKSTEEEGEPSEPQELVLTKVGMEADLAIIGELLGKEAKDKAIIDTKDMARAQSDFVGVCPRELKEGEACYSPEYYEQFRLQADN